MFKLLGWFGGRSLDEMKDRDPRDYGTSILVGGFGLISAGTIAGGQYLFWSHLPHLASSAPLITAIITPLYVGMYRGVVRALETMNVLGKVATLLVVAGIGGTNGMLVGHELALLAFDPQVNTLTAFNATESITKYGGAVEGSLGLPQLRTDEQRLNGELKTARDEYARIPVEVIRLQAQAKACDASATKRYANLPPAGDESYMGAYRAWRDQVLRCSADRKTAGAILADHQKRFRGEIDILATQKLVADKKLGDATVEYDTKLEREKPVLTDGARTGFARHQGLWSAVDAKLIPAWSAYGLVFVVMALEMMCFLLKIFMTPDKLTLERQNTAKKNLYEGKVELQDLLFKGDMMLRVLKSCRAAIPSMITDTRIAAYVKDWIEGIVIPTVQTRQAADAFMDATDYVERAQRRVTMMGRLHQLAAEVRKRMGELRTGPRPVPPEPPEQTEASEAPKEATR